MDARLKTLQNMDHVGFFVFPQTITRPIHVPATPPQRKPSLQTGSVSRYVVPFQVPLDVKATFPRTSPPHFFTIPLAIYSKTRRHENYGWCLPKIDSPFCDVVAPSSSSTKLGEPCTKIVERVRMAFASFQLQNIFDRFICETQERQGHERWT